MVLCQSRCWRSARIYVLLSVAFGSNSVGAITASACSSSPPGSTGVISSVTDLDSLALCTTYRGSISLETNNIPNITLPSLTSIDGSILANESNITTLSLPLVTSVSSLSLTNLPHLSTLNLPALTNVSGISLSHLPMLEHSTVGIGTGKVLVDISFIHVIDTALRSLEWIMFPVSETLSISSNKYLTSFKFPTTVLAPGSSYAITYNPSLTKINVSNLRDITGTLEINNCGVESLNFSSLSQLSGNVKLNGNLTDISAPKLDVINGGLYVESMGNVTAFCTFLATNKRWTGHFSCQSSLTPVARNNTTGIVSAVATPPMDNSKDKRRLDTGGIAGIAFGAALFVASIVGATILFRRERKRRGDAEWKACEATKGAKGYVLQLETSELESPGGLHEVSNEKEAQELSHLDLEHIDGISAKELDAEGLNATRGSSEIIQEVIMGSVEEIQRAKNEGEVKCKVAGEDEEVGSSHDETGGDVGESETPKTWHHCPNHTDGEDKKATLEPASTMSTEE